MCGKILNEETLLKYSYGLEYTLLDDDTYSVSGIGECTDVCVVIPAVYDGKLVTNISDAAFAHTAITRIVIPDSVTTIGHNAFYGCSVGYTVSGNIKYLMQGDNPFKIAIDVFDRTDTTCTIHKDTKIIVDGALHGKGLTSIDLDEENKHFKLIDGVIYSTDGTTLVSYPEWSDDATVQIPESVTNIGNWAFSYCKSLESITIPDSVTSIGNSAFLGCTSLTEVEIPSSITSIGNEVFSNCTSLVNVEIPDSITSISPWLFWECFSLESVVIPDSVTSIGKGAFVSCSALKSIVIPASVTNMDATVFSDYSSLTIYCEIESKPDDWNSYWNSSNRPVVWGCNKQ